MLVNLHDRARGAHTGLRNMRESMRESADLLKNATASLEGPVDSGSPSLQHIQDLQAEVFRLRHALQSSESQSDMNFYRLLDLQEEGSAQREQIRGLQVELLDLQGEGSAQQEQIRGLQVELLDLQGEGSALREEVRGLQVELQNRVATINALSSDLEDSLARESDEKSRHQSMALSLGAELAQWQAYAADLNLVLGDMMSSRSWRLTWVLRALSATLRGRKSTGPDLPEAPIPRGNSHDGE